MPLDQRIIDLTAELLRAEDPAVVETVADLLHIAINEHVQNVTAERSRASIIQLNQLPAGSGA